MLNKFLKSFVFILVAVSSLSAGQMHVLLVGNTDTPSDDIGVSCAADLAKMRTEIYRTASLRDESVKLTILRGRRFDSDLVAEWIEDLRPAKDDSIFFYFSGHGYRTSDALSQEYPLLDFSGYSPDLDLWNITQALAAKRARLTVVIADCCNNTLQPWEVYPTEPIQLERRVKLVGDTQSSHSLIDFEGVIVAAGAVPEQYAESTDDGGEFTVSWIRNLRYELLSNEPSWDRLFLRVWKELVPDQQPMVEFFQNAA